MNEDSQKPDVLFSFATGSQDPHTILLSQCLKIQSSLDALSFILAEVLANLTEEEPKEVMDRLLKLREEMQFSNAATLRDIFPPSEPES